MTHSSRSPTPAWESIGLWIRKATAYAGQYRWLLLTEVILIGGILAWRYCRSPVLYESGASVLMDFSRKQFYEPVFGRIYGSASHIRKGNVVHLFLADRPLELLRARLRELFEQKSSPSELAILLTGDSKDDVRRYKKSIRWEGVRNSDHYLVFCRATHPASAQALCKVYLDAIEQYYFDETLNSIREEFLLAVTQFPEVGRQELSSLKQDAVGFMQSLAQLEWFYRQQRTRSGQSQRLEIDEERSLKALAEKHESQKLRLEKLLSQSGAAALKATVDKIRPQVSALEQNLYGGNIGFIRTMEPTKSDYRVSPQITRYVAAFLSFAGFTLFVTFPLLFYFFPRVFVVGEVEGMGGTILGRVPKLKNTLSELEKLSGAFFEYVSVLNHPLIKLIESKSGLVVTVTSASSGEGKSTVSRLLSGVATRREKRCRIIRLGEQDPVVEDFEAIVRGAREKNDLVVIDMPDLFTSYECARGLRFADLILVVVRLGFSRSNLVTELLGMCGSFSGARVGVVVNGCQAPRFLDEWKSSKSSKNSKSCFIPFYRALHSLYDAKHGKNVTGIF